MLHLSSSGYGSGLGLRPPQAKHWQPPFHTSSQTSLSVKQPIIIQKEMIVGIWMLTIRNLIQAK